MLSYEEETRANTATREELLASIDNWRRIILANEPALIYRAAGEIEEWYLQQQLRMRKEYGAAGLRIFTSVGAVLRDLAALAEVEKKEG